MFITAALVLILSGSASAELFSGYLGRPLVIDGDPDLRIVLCVNSLSGEKQIAFLSEGEDGTWQVRAAFGGTARAAAASGKLVYIFEDDAYSVYQDDKWVKTLEWKRPWQVDAAIGGAPGGDELWAFGVSASVVKPPEGTPGRAGEAKWQVHAAVFRGDQWTEPPNGPSFDAYCSVARAVDVRAAWLRGALYVFWQSRDTNQNKDEHDTIHYATVTGEGWGKPARMKGVARTTRFAVCGGDTLWLFMKDSSHGISEKHPVVCRSFDGSAWSESETIGGLDDPLQDGTLYLMSGRHKGRPSAIIASVQIIRIVQRDEADRGWTEPATVYSLPYADRVYVALAVGLMFSALMIGVGVSLWRTRGRVIVLETPAGTLLVADWRLRAVAAIFDFSLISMLCLLLTEIIRGEPPEHIQFILMMHVLSVPYSLICETAMGQTPGKRLAGIVVVASDGLRPTHWQIVIRSALRLVDAFVLAPVGMLFILNTRLAQRAGDLLARTIVIRIPGPRPKEPS